MLRLLLAIRPTPLIQFGCSRRVIHKPTQPTNFSIRSTMKRAKEPSRRPPKRREVPRFNDVLAQIQHSGSIYFVESLPKAAIQTLKTRKTATLALPSQFVQEHGDKTKQWVILRAHSSCGRPARPQVVQLHVSASSCRTGKIRIGGGLYAAIASNRLQEGDSLVFVPQADAPRRLEFEVYTFRGLQEFPLFPDEGDSASSTDEENNNNQSNPLTSPSHHQDEHKEEFTSDVTEGNCKASALQSTNQLGPHLGFYKQVPASHIGPEYPGFYKLLAASHIGRSDRNHLTNTGQFEFPKDFMRTHGKRVQASVKLQGVHEDSPVHSIPCRRRSENRFRMHLLVSGWCKFVADNGLKKGHKLQFSLVADSYFVVRKV